MAEFKISRFRYTWQGEWDTATATYNKDDIVLYQGKAWVCIRQHAPSTFGEDQTYIPPGNTDVTPAWVKMTDGQKFLGDWTNNELYDEGVLVLAGGNIYIALATHTSAAQFATDSLKWEVFATGSNFRNTWSTATRYRVGDVVRYNGYTYECVLEHTSGTVSDGVIVGNADADADSTAETWKVVVENYTYVGEYTASTRYRLNDLVKYGGSILKCIAEHTSSSTLGLIDNTKFVTYLSGFEFDNEWNNSTYYAVGDVVRFGGIVHVAAENNINSQPGKSQQSDTINPAWTVITKGINFVGEYDPGSGIDYREGDNRTFKNGFRVSNYVYNNNPGGSIYETSGRLNPQGRAPFMRVSSGEGGSVEGFEGKSRGRRRSTRTYSSDNPFAGYQFVTDLPPVTSQPKMKDVRSGGRKTKGRLIYRAWAEDSGKVYNAILQAVNATVDNFNDKTKISSAA
jgi:hypothetical protein